MIDLEQALEDLARRVVIPREQWLADEVLRRIGEPATRPLRRRVPQLAALAVVAVVLLLLVLPGPRRAVGRWLGFDSVRIEPGVTVPTTNATVPAIDTDLQLGPAISINEAMASTGLPDPTPTALGRPGSIHVVEPPVSGQILVVYPPSELLPQSPVTGVGALVSVMPAHIESGFFQKTLGTDATVRPIDFAGVHGFWIEGSPHQLFFEIGQDQVQQDTLRLATNTLLWERNGHVYRLEADISLETAVAIASSIPAEG
jgi:hypothetical protein